MEEASKEVIDGVTKQGTYSECLMQLGFAVSYCLLLSPRGACSYH